MPPSTLIDTLTLCRLPGLTDTMRRSLFEHFSGEISVLLEQPTTALADMQPASRERLRQALLPSVIATARARAEEELAFCYAHDIKVLIRGEKGYPHRLMACSDGPLHLFYRGTANLDASHMVAIVGTRQITPYGQALCQTLVEGIARLAPGCVIVSGLAYGADIHTHRACLATGMETIGVLAHGLDQIYPPAHRQSAAEMTRQGGLLTEHFSGTHIEKINFVRRNRIVAGLTDATIVVESAAHGGSLITAGLATDYNREVMAIPGRITDPYSAGCNALIARGEAHAITSAEDIGRLLGWQTSPKAAPQQPDLFASLSPTTP